MNEIEKRRLQLEMAQRAQAGQTTSKLNNLPQRPSLEQQMTRQRVQAAQTTNKLNARQLGPKPPSQRIIDAQNVQRVQAAGTTKTLNERPLTPGNGKKGFGVIAPNTTSELKEAGGEIAAATKGFGDNAPATGAAIRNTAYEALEGGVQTAAGAVQDVARPFAPLIRGIGGFFGYKGSVDERRAAGEGSNPPTTLASAVPPTVAAPATETDGRAAATINTPNFAKPEQGQQQFDRIDLGNGMERLQVLNRSQRPDAEQSSVMTTSGDIPQPAAESTENIRGTNVSYQRTPASNAFSPDVNYGAGPKYVNDPNQVDAAGGEPGHMYGHVKSPDQVQDGALYRLNTGAANRSAPVDSGAVGDAPDWFPTNVEVDSALGFTQEGLRAAGVKGVGKDVYSEVTDRQNADSSTLNSQANMVNANANARDVDLRDARAYDLAELRIAEEPDGRLIYAQQGRNGQVHKLDLTAWASGSHNVPKGLKEFGTDADGKPQFLNEQTQEVIKLEDQLLKQERNAIVTAAGQSKEAGNAAYDKARENFGKRQMRDNKSEWEDLNAAEQDAYFDLMHEL